MRLLPGNTMRLSRRASRFGALGREAVVADVRWRMGGSASVAAAAPMGTMASTSIQNAAQTKFLFVCGRSVCGGEDVCGD